MSLCAKVTIRAKVSSYTFDPSGILDFYPYFNFYSLYKKSTSLLFILIVARKRCLVIKNKN